MQTVLGAGCRDVSFHGQATDTKRKSDNENNGISPSRTILELIRSSGIDDLASCFG